jgi:hypothetical protein
MTDYNCQLKLALFTQGIKISPEQYKQAYPIIEAHINEIKKII